MPRCAIFALALLSALTGCLNPPPRGPLVEYRTGQVPKTRTVRCEANYVLVTKNATSANGQLTEHHIVKGERVGFRREDDGTVTAIAPGYTVPLPDGAYAWEVVRTSVPPWRERLWCETRDRSVATGKVTLFVVGACCVVAVALVLIYAYAQGDTDNDPATLTNKKKK